MKNCNVKSCIRKYYAKGFCFRHYEQIRVRGKIYHAKQEPNEVFDRGEYMEMALYNQKREIVAYTKFDKEDIDKVKNYKWFLTKLCYVYSSKIGMFHRFIMNIPKGMETDHKLGNTLDNRKSQLRIATKSQNKMNLRKILSKSGYRGVIKKGNKFYARIKMRPLNKHVWLGSYNTAAEAARAYNKAALKYFGEFANINIL